MEEKFFDDNGIKEESFALVRNKTGITNGISLTIEADGHFVEIVLEREQIEKCLKALNEDWEIHKAIVEGKNEK
jgi:bifunctional DNA-binding transcriptional regulator/antitoxin component of YhaV-PrlF toxin-antitoxin module